MGDTSQEILDNSRVVIVDQFNYEETTKETFTIKYSTFELCTIFVTRMIEVFKWDGLIISCHGVPFPPKWCLDEISQDQPIKIENFLILNL